MASASRSVVKRFPIGAQCTGSCHLEEHAYQLLCACASGNLTLLLHCAKKCGNPFKNCDSLGRNTLHIAAMYGHNSIVEWILERQLVDVNCYDIESRWTPLHYSIHFGQPGTAILLMKVCDTCLCKYICCSLTNTSDKTFKMDNYTSTLLLPLLPYYSLVSNIHCVLFGDDNV